MSLRNIIIITGGYERNVTATITNITGTPNPTSTVSVFCSWSGGMGPYKVELFNNVTGLSSPIANISSTNTVSATINVSAEPTATTYYLKVTDLSSGLVSPTASYNYPTNAYAISLYVSVTRSSTWSNIYGADMAWLYSISMSWTGGYSPFVAYLYVNGSVNKSQTNITTSNYNFSFSAEKGQYVSFQGLVTDKYNTSSPLTNGGSFS